jgi:hypothetical protein
MSELKTKVESIRQKIADAKQEMREASQQLFTEETKNVFQAHPLLSEFRWTQYTPYFNDGNECVFSAGTDTPGISMIDEDESEYFLECVAVDKRVRGEQLTSREAAGLDIVAFLQMFDEEILKEMFGDHVKIIVRRNGELEIDDYEHE